MENNFARNLDHYQVLYSTVDKADLLSKLNNFDAWFENAIRTDTSWVGTYYGDLKTQIAGATILEIGAGNCLNSLAMLKLGAEKVVAVDLAAPEAVVTELAQELGLQSRFDLVVGDFLQIPFALHSFDFVIGKAFLHHLTIEQEALYLEKIASLLKDTGEARFFELCTNSKLLTTLQYLIPVPGRPPKWRPQHYRAWRENDPEPIRDNSSNHYEAAGKKYFRYVEIVPLGGFERFHRLLPAGKMSRRFRRIAYKIERLLPFAVQRYIARSQIVIYRQPLSD